MATDVLDPISRSLPLELRELFVHLWHDFLILESDLTQFIWLFGGDPERVVLLNRTCPGFANRVQRLSWQGLILQISRLLDPPATGKYENLTLARLCEAFAQRDNSVATRTVCADLSSRLDRITAAAAAIKSHRDKLYGHADLKTRLGVTELGPLVRLDLETARDGIGGLLSTVYQHFSGSPLCGDSAEAIYDTEQLLAVLARGSSRSGNPIP